MSGCARCALLFTFLVTSCGQETSATDPELSVWVDSTPSRHVLTLEGRVGDVREVTIWVATPTVLAVDALGARLDLDDVAPESQGSLLPRVLGEGAHVLRVTRAVRGTLRVVIAVFGAKIDAAAIERSLVWRQSAVLDDPERVGMRRLMSALADDGHGGRLFAAWLSRFATTSHSERAAPALFAEALSARLGGDPGEWDLDLLPFVVTAVHNRLDLRTTTHCGELRVSLACTDPQFQPFHVIMRFRQEPRADDVSATGEVHCVATAHAWARYGVLDEEAFVVDASSRLAEGLVRERFIDAETVEFMVSPWEWRQWDLVENGDPQTAAAVPWVFDNPPLFQTVDIPRMNEPGADREAFLTFVTDNAAGLAGRTVLIPERFRSRSARLNAGIPWVPLDLGALPETLAADFPTLRQQIEIVGCPACHATDAEFVQTNADRVFSPFYDKELEARAAYLVALSSGTTSAAPFGPLQATPRLQP